MQLTATYSLQQNGVAERKNRSLMEMARCMLIDGKMEKRYWGEAVNTANYLQNRLSTKATDKTPYELWYSRVPDVSDLKVFGCEVYAHVPKELRKKLDQKAKKLIFVGYSEESKAFPLLDKNTNKITISHDVIFLDAVSNENKRKQEINMKEVHEEKREATSAEVVISPKKKTSVNSLVHRGPHEENQKQGEVESVQVNDKSLDKQPAPKRSQRSNKGVPPDMFIASAKMTVEEPKTREPALSGPHKDK